MRLRTVKGGDREKANDENLQEGKSRGENIQWLYANEFHKISTSPIQGKTGQFWTRQILDTSNSS